MLNDLRDYKIKCDESNLQKEEFKRPVVDVLIGNLSGFSLTSFS